MCRAFARRRRGRTGRRGGVRDTAGDAGLDARVVADASADGASSDAGDVDAAAPVDAGVDATAEAGPVDAGHFRCVGYSSSSVTMSAPSHEHAPALMNVQCDSYRERSPSPSRSPSARMMKVEESTGTSEYE